MVQNAGKTLCINTVKPVNLPEPVSVKEDPSGKPVAINLPHRQTVTAIDDRWRIDDEWWRSEPVARLYYTVRLATGNRQVIYKDLISGQWYKQTY